MHCRPLLGGTFFCVVQFPMADQGHGSGHTFEEKVLSSTSCHCNNKSLSDGVTCINESLVERVWSPPKSQANIQLSDEVEDNYLLDHRDNTFGHTQGCRYYESTTPNDDSYTTGLYDVYATAKFSKQNGFGYENSEHSSDHLHSYTEANSPVIVLNLYSMIKF